MTRRPKPRNNRGAQIVFAVFAVLLIITMILQLVAV